MVSSCTNAYHVRSQMYGDIGDWMRKHFICHGFQSVNTDALARTASENLDANYPTGHRPTGWEVLEVEHHSLHASMLHMTGWDSLPWRLYFTSLSLWFWRDWASRRNVSVSVLQWCYHVSNMTVYPLFVLQFKPPFKIRPPEPVHRLP